MHILSNTHETSTDETLIKLLTEKSTRKILSLLQDKPTTIIKIAPKCEFSINLIYRRIHELEKLHMLYVSGKMDTDNKRKFYYQSKIKSFDLRFIDGETYLDIIYHRRFSDNIGS